jgi:transcription elongation factor SPT6
VEQLDEDDLALIQEAQGEKEREDEVREQARAVRAHNEAELRKGLFYDSEEEQVTAKKGPARVERYDEDGMDDFIDDDIGDQGDIIARGQREEEGGFRTGVSEAQLTEASEIFGTDYLEFMGADEAEDEDDDEIMGRKYRERGVGVDLGVYSEEDELISEEDDDDEDLFGDDDDEEDESGQTARQRAEALKLKREKREMAKAERRKQARLKKAERRKARLRRAFEPVQLVENFCTDKDDEIRMRDAPERFYEWTTPFHGSTTEEIGDEEEEEAMWIMARIPDIATEFFSPPPSLSLTEDLSAALEKRQKAILDSIVHSLRYMHRDKMEPDFIKRYRADYVTSPAVRENLFSIMDEDGKWDQMVHAREKVEGILTAITSDAKKEVEGDAEAENVTKLTEVLQVAQAKLDETLKQESDMKEQLTEFVDLDTNMEDEGDDDEDLFGKDDDDEEENEVSLTATGMN